MRVENWTQKLNKIIEDRRSIPFQWGVNDCALFAADVVRDMTGEDYAEKWRDRYTTAIGCGRVLRNEETTLEEQITLALGEPVAAPMLKRGDVGLFDTGRGETAGICVGRYLVAPGPAGLEWVPMSYCLKGWHV